MSLFKHSLYRVKTTEITRGVFNLRRLQSNKAETTTNEEKNVRPASSVPHGTVLKGINFMKGKSDPMAKEDNEYPEWLWTLLDAKVKNDDVFSREYQRKVNKDAIKAKNFLKKR